MTQREAVKVPTPMDTREKATAAEKATCLRLTGRVNAARAMTAPYAAAAAPHNATPDNVQNTTHRGHGTLCWNLVVGLPWPLTMPTLQTYNACIVSIKQSAPYLGEFEYSVLLGILQIEDAYAVPLRTLLEERTGRPVARGALYTALERLEAKGCLTSRMAGPTDARGGKPRRYFSLTPLGMRALRATHGALSNLARGLEGVLEQS